MDFDKIWYGDASRPSGHPQLKNLRISEIRDGGCHHLEKYRNRDMSLILMKLGKMIHLGPSDPDS